MAAMAVALAVGGALASSDGSAHLPPDGSDPQFRHEHPRKPHQPPHYRRDGHGHHSPVHTRDAQHPSGWPQPPRDPSVGASRDALETARNHSYSIALERRKSLADRDHTHEKAAGDEAAPNQSPGRKDLRQLAQRTCSMLTKSGVDYWLDFGSLLGLMREGNILEGDTDVDISVVDTPENVEKLENSRAPLADMGVFLKKELTWNAYRAASSLGYVHLYLTPLVNHSYQGAIGDGSEISSDLIGTPTLFDWQGTQVAIPQHTHATLVARYGDNYMDPEAYYANKSFQGRHPGSDGWNQLVQMREQRLRTRNSGRVANAVPESAAKPAAELAKFRPAAATARAAARAAQVGPDLEAASATLSRHLVSYERRMKDDNYARSLSVKADSDRSAMALDHAVQHHKQVLDNLQAQYGMTTHPETRERLLSQIAQHKESAARAELEAANLPRDEQRDLYRKSGKARDKSSQPHGSLAPGSTLDGLTSSKLPRMLPAESWAARSEQHATQREAVSLARKAKDAAHETRLREYAERVTGQADSDRAALALGATKQHETELVDNLETRLSSTTDSAARELLRSQIASHREAAARAELEAVSMHGSEERHNGMTRDKMSFAMSKRLLLRVERGEDGD